MSRLKNANPLFILGTPRSGTTVLCRILNAHPRILMTNETAVFFQWNELILKNRCGYKAGVLYGKQYHELWADQLLAHSRRLIESYYEEIANRQQKHQIRYWGEKHPHNCHCLDFIKKQWPSAKYLYLIRDPRDTACSMGKMLHKPFREQLTNWKAFADRFESFIAEQEVDHTLTLKYEKLVCDYDGVLENVFDWLGLDYPASTQNYVEKIRNQDAHIVQADGEFDRNVPSSKIDYSLQSVGRWSRELSEADQHYSLEQVGDYLIRYGYESDIDPTLLKKANTNNFLCNICGTENTLDPSILGRETPSCRKCRSTVRMRAVMHALGRGLFDSDLRMDEFPERPDLRGLGLSDWSPYAERLGRKFSYTNTYYDREPQLDIQNPDDSLFGTFDFIVASDVFEHVAPPVERAFENLRRLLKPTGVLIFSVPYSLEPHTREHFPDLHDYRIEGRGGRSRLINRTREGEVQEFDDLVFHGGEGATLEMRVFSLADLRDQFSRAGFQPPEIHDTDVPAFGICWDCDWSLPMSVRPLA